MAEPKSATLYFSENLNPRVAVAVARHLDSPVTLTRASPQGEDKDWFQKINPNRLVPVLVEPDKIYWETDAIAYRLAEVSGGSFWPAEHMAEIIMWLSWSSAHFTLAGSAYYWENVVRARWFNHVPVNQASLDDAAKKIGRYGRILDEALATRDWLVGDALTYADFRVGTCLPFVEEAQIPLEEFPNIRKWHARLAQIEAWRDPFLGLAG